MVVRTLVRACAVFVVALVMSSPAAAQDGVPLSGRLLNSLNGAPLGGATVQIDELRRQTTSAADGTFTFDNVPPGTYHLSVRAQGFSSRRTEVSVAAGAAAIELQVDFELHFEEVVSVSADARSQFESFQPTSVLAGQELSKQLEMSLGATLESQPGVASRSFGPAPARPVIRGLDGDRVLILQDGQRLGDLSSQSGDHGVPINPAAAQRIEVVRGPATLLYGANAIGGLVNVITDEIPTKPQTGASGNFTFDLGSAASEGGGAGDVHVGNGTFALHAGGGGRRSGDVDTPEGDVVNSQSRSGFGNVGLSWTGAKGYFGGSYGYDDTKYGIPVVEEGQVQLTPRRHAFSLRGGAQGLDGAFDSYRATLAVRRYKHDELEGDEVGTAFTNNTAEVEVMGSHRALGRLKGSVGGWVLNRAFDATGAEALSPAVDQRGFAAFLYEEVTWPHVTFQFGGRVDHTSYEPNGEPESILHERLGIARAAVQAGGGRRPPDDCAQPGACGAESGARGAVLLRAAPGQLRVRGRQPRSAARARARLRRVAALAHVACDGRSHLLPQRHQRLPVQGAAHRGGIRRASRRSSPPGSRVATSARRRSPEDEEGFPIVEYVAADSVLQGVEAHCRRPGDVADRCWSWDSTTCAERSRTDDEPLPRIPPLRSAAGCATSATRSRRAAR